MNRILVTGANGFIGRRLCQILMQCGYEVRTVLRRFYLDDDFSLLEQVIVSDIGPNTSWKETLQDVDCVVHLAGRVHVMEEIVVDALSEFRLVNVEGTINFARQSAVADIKRFIYLSSIKVNGETTQLGHPFKTADLPVPTDAYAISKFEAEQALWHIAATTEMKMVIIRPPLVYGPRVKANFLNMMRWLNKGIPLPLGAIYNKRSLIALDNLVDLIITCIEHPAATNQTFLAGDGEDLSTTELLRRMGQELGKPAKLFPVPARFLELVAQSVGKKLLAQRICASLQVDIHQTRVVLDWKPVVTVDEALKKTAKAYLEENIA